MTAKPARRCVQDGVAAAGKVAGFDKGFSAKILKNSMASPWDVEKEGRAVKRELMKSNAKTEFCAVRREGGQLLVQENLWNAGKTAILETTITHNFALQREIRPTARLI